MPNRNWSVRLAIIGACFALAFVASWTGFVVGLSQSAHERDYSETIADCGPDGKQSCPSQTDRNRTGLPDIAESIASGPDPKNTDEREKRDLAAQESMSVWAFWMLVVSAIGTVTTMIGTGFLLWQIILTREAVKDTGDATKAMIRANKIAEAAQRAWMVAEPKIIEASYEKAGLNLKWECHFRNIGQTVAEDVRVQASIEIYDPPSLEVGDLFAKLRTRTAKPISVIPGEYVTGGAGESYCVVDAIAQHEASEAVSILLVATAQYRIASDEAWHRTERAYALTVSDSWFTVLNSEYEKFTTDNIIYRSLGYYTIST